MYESNKTEWNQEVSLIITVHFIYKLHIMNQREQYGISLHPLLDCTLYLYIAYYESGRMVMESDYIPYKFVHCIYTLKIMTHIEHYRISLKLLLN